MTAQSKMLLRKWNYFSNWKWTRQKFSASEIRTQMNLRQLSWTKTSFFFPSPRKDTASSMPASKTTASQHLSSIQWRKHFSWRQVRKITRACQRYKWSSREGHARVGQNLFEMPKISIIVNEFWFPSLSFRLQILRKRKAFDRDFLKARRETKFWTDGVGNGFEILYDFKNKPL